jgi:hypothetical protein
MMTVFIKLCDILLSDIMLSDIMLIAIILSVAYSERHCAVCLFFQLQLIVNSQMAFLNLSDKPDHYTPSPLRTKKKKVSKKLL